MVGFLASSKAGHDKNKVYVIIREEEEYVWLADGRLKTVSSPKKKSKKHIQPIKYFYDEELRKLLLEGRTAGDQKIMTVLQRYRSKQINE